MFVPGEPVILVELPPYCDRYIRLGDRFVVQRVEQSALDGTKVYVNDDRWFRPERFRSASNQGEN